MTRAFSPGLAVRLVPCALLLAACSSSSTPAKSDDAGVQHDTGTLKQDTGTLKHDTGTEKDTGTAKDSGKEADGGSPTKPTTTIAAVRQNSPTGSFTVEGFVTALAGGKVGDFPQWYIEDPAGGQYSGIVVYCDPDVTKACLVPEPALHDLILVTGTLDPYKGQLEISPTAMTVVQSNATFPPIAALTLADIAPAANSPYRGVFVSLTLTGLLTVDDVTPTALADTASSCGAVFTDGGVASCTSACEPPVYGGFRAKDGTGTDVYIEAPFYLTDPLQSSPECLTQSGVVDVVVGTTFSSMQGVLDIDPYSGDQALSPVQATDYDLVSAK